MDVLAPLERLGATSIVASSAQVTNATTNIDCVSHTIPANHLQVGSVYRLTAYLTFVHANAGATPTLTVELLVNGAAVLASVTTPPSTIVTTGVHIEAVFTCRSVGASGTINSFVAGWMNGSTAASPGATSQDNATTTVDTTVARTILLRVRMTTAVASNSIRCNQAFVEQLR